MGAYGSMWHAGIFCSRGVPGSRGKMPGKYDGFGFECAQNGLVGQMHAGMSSPLGREWLVWAVPMHARWCHLMLLAAERAFDAFDEQDINHIWIPHGCNLGGLESSLR